MIIRFKGSVATSLVRPFSILISGTVIHLIALHTKSKPIVENFGGRESAFGICLDLGESRI
jgi:hypothetical protein